MASSTDNRTMQAALNLARRGLGRAAPNPSVGCILVKKGRVVGRGWTGDGGRPHAETVALEQAGSEAKGATAYVTFEPCSHKGQTPPCTGALISAEVSRVVIACEDPDPRVSGQGIRQLQVAGLDVETGVLEEEALKLNQGFILKTTEQRPLVTFKCAASNDGKILEGDGQPKWVTGEPARKRGHLERSLHDAILVGMGTVLADDPVLTTRLEGHDHVITRVILDARLEIPLDSKLIKSNLDNPLWIFYQEGPEDKITQLKDAGCRLFPCKDKSLKPILETLAVEGITRLLVEGGPTIHGAFLQENMVDRLLWFKSPETLGNKGRKAIEGHDITKIEGVNGLKHQKTAAFSEDLLEIYEKQA